jgi:alpha-glucosidase
VREAVGQWRDEPGEGWPSWAMSNHDAPRAPSRFARSEAEVEPAARLSLMLLLCLRGNAFLYQGEELGLPQAEVPFERLRDPEAIANWPATLGRDGARTPMPWTVDAPYAGFSSVEPWLPMDPRHCRLAIDRQASEAGSMMNFTRRLLAFRKDRPELVRGGLKWLDAPEPVLAFERSGDGGRVVCALNLGREPVAWRPDGPGWRVVFSTVEGAAGLPERLSPLSGWVLSR